MIAVYGIAGCFLALFAWLAITRPWKMAVPLVDAHLEGRRVDEAGVFGNYYPTVSAGTGPGVLIVGGSEGGIDGQVDRDARAISREGYSVLAMSFFRGPRQPIELALIPLETFDRALSWLKQQPEVEASRVAMIGMSKGAEAALLIASRRSDLQAVVAAVPSSVVWPGFDWAKFRGLKQSSWSLDGRPLPMLPYGRFSWAKGVRSIYEAGLAAITDHPEAIIPVEKSKAPILLICGGEDQVWPSCVMAEQIVERAHRLKGPPIIVLSYPNADHGAFASPLETGDKPRRFGFRRPAAGNPSAQADSWPKVIAFLRENFAAD